MSLGIFLLLCTKSTSVCACVSVCVREREREKLRTAFGALLMSYLPLLEEEHIRVWCVHGVAKGRGGSVGRWGRA